jgi:hypothetical protein
LKYSTAADLAVATESTGIGPSQDNGPSPVNISPMAVLLKELPELDDDDLRSAVVSADSKVSSRRLGGRVAAANLKPMVLVKEKTVVLPTTVKDANNYIGHYLMKAANKLGYRIRLIPYTGEIADVTDYNIDVALGIYMSLEDETANFNFKEKKDPYEVGRTYARSQQIIGVLSAKEKLGPDILKMNEHFFGNYRVPKGTTEKTAKKGSDYWIHSAGALFYETRLRDSLVKCLVTLMRQSWVVVAPDVLWNNIYPYLIDYNTIVKENCGKEVVVSPAKKNKPAIMKVKIPSKPRQNNLLLKQELEFLARISNTVWEPTPWENLKATEWASVVFTDGLPSIKEALSKIYNKRSAYLTRLATLTTKRLNRLRAVGGASTNKTTRKADIKVNDLTELLISAEDPYETFVEELLLMDPTHNLFLASYCADVNIEQIPDGQKRAVTQFIHDTLYEELRKTKLYDEVKKHTEEQQKKFVDTLEKMTKAVHEQNEFMSKLRNKYGDATMNKWSKNINYDFTTDAKRMGSKTKPKWDKAVTVIDKTVPHSTSKAQPKPSKQRIEEERYQNITDHWLNRCRQIFKNQGDSPMTTREVLLRAAFATYAEHKDVPNRFDSVKKFMTGKPPSDAIVQSILMTNPNENWGSDTLKL